MRKRIFETTELSNGSDRLSGIYDYSMMDSVFKVYGFLKT